MLLSVAVRLLLQVAGNFFFNYAVVSYCTVAAASGWNFFFLIMYFNDLLGWAFKILGPSQF